MEEPDSKSCESSQKVEVHLREESHSPHYEFYIIGQQPIQTKCKQIAGNDKRRYTLNEISTVTIAAMYKEGRKSKEIIIPKVPTFLYDCSAILYAKKEMNNEVFRKPGMRKRLLEFHKSYPDAYIRGCNFENLNLSDLDIGCLLKAFIRDKLEPIFYSGEPILDEMETMLNNEQGIEFDVESNPEFGTFLFVIKFLHALCLNDPAKRLTPLNLAIVFAPNVIQEQKEKTTMDKATATVNTRITLVEKLINNSQHLGVKRNGPDLKRTRSSSISIDRSKTFDNMRRSSSVIGRVLRYMNKEPLRRINSVSRETFHSGSPDVTVRLSRSRSRRTPNATMRRGEVFESVGKLNRRLSNVGFGSPNGSQSSMTDGLSRNSMIQWSNYDEYGKRLRFTETSLTTQPPSEASLFSKTNDLEVADPLNLSHLDYCSPELDISMNIYVKSVLDPTCTPELTNYRSEIQLPKSSTSPPLACTTEGVAFDFEDGNLGALVPVAQANEENSKTIEDEQKKPAKQVYKTQFAVPVEALRNDQVNKNIDSTNKLSPETIPSSDDCFKKPMKTPKMRTANKSGNATRSQEVVKESTCTRRSRSSFLDFGTDMANIIMTSTNPEDLDYRANMTQANRPSLALLNERKQVTKTIAKLEKQVSTDETPSPRRSTKFSNSPKPGSSRSSSTTSEKENRGTFNKHT